MYIQLENFGHGSSVKSIYCDGTYECIERIHQFPELVCVMEGAVEITVDGKTQTANVGDLAVITPFRTHSFKTPEYCKIWIGVISPDLAEDFLSDENVYISDSDAVFTPSRSLFDYVTDHLPPRHDRHVELSGSEATYRSIKALAYTVFEEYLRLVPQRLTHLNGSALATVLIYLSLHYTENITLGSVAQALGYSPTYISHCISVIPNMNFRALVNSLRTDKAKMLILRGELRMIDIAFECGFTSERSFNRAFLSVTGLTPTEYKARNIIQ